MKRSHYIILSVIAVVLLIAYLILKPTERVQVTYEVPDVQLAIDIANIVKIDIERGSEHIRLERLQNRWRITQPINTLVDDEGIYYLLEGMARFRLTGLVSSKVEKHGEYQVGPEGTKVTVTNEDGESLALIVGKEGPTPKQSFVRPANLNTVYLAKGLVPSLVNKSLREWKQRTIFRTQPDLIRLFSIRSAYNVTVRNTGKNWMYGEKVIPAQLIQQQLNMLSFLRAEDVIDTSIIITSSARLRFEILARELFKFDVYPQRGKYLLKSSISPVVYVVSRELVRDLENFVNILAAPIPDEIAEMMSPTTIVETTTTEIDTELTVQERMVLEALTTQTLTVAKEESSIEEEGELIVHTVGKNETLETIARKYKVTVPQLTKWNLLRERDVVRPGMELYVFVVKK